jgi:hypothetical protein
VAFHDAVLLRRVRRRGEVIDSFIRTPSLGLNWIELASTIWANALSRHPFLLSASVWIFLNLKLRLWSWVAPATYTCCNHLQQVGNTDFLSLFRAWLIHIDPYEQAWVVALNSTLLFEETRACMCCFPIAQPSQIALMCATCGIPRTMPCLDMAFTARKWRWPSLACQSHAGSSTFARRQTGGEI